jgi:membrane dipeptidase
MATLRRRLLTSAAVLGGSLLLLAVVGASEGDDDAGMTAIRELLRETPLIDGHNDAPWVIRDKLGNRLEGFDFHETSTLELAMHTDIRRLRAGGVGGQFWSVWVPPELEGGAAVVTVLEQIDLVHRLIERYPQDLELALTADDIVSIHGRGKIASLIGVEGGYSIGESLPVLRQLFALGARYMTLTHWKTTSWCDSATDAPRHDGLSPFGLEVVREMNRLGMMVDLSHVSAAAMRDAIEVSRAPVIFSHSSAGALNPHPRNVPDDILEMVRDRGGVVMVNFGTFFLSTELLERYAESRGERARLEVLYPGDSETVDSELDAWLEAMPMPKLTVAEVADHIDHIRDVAGIDHVGLGSDFDGIKGVPEGLEDVSGYPALLAELARRRYSREELAKKVAGLNLLRVMREVEAVAAAMKGVVEPSEATIGSDPQELPPHHD